VNCFFGRRELVVTWIIEDGALQANLQTSKVLFSFLTWRNYYFEIQNRKENTNQWQELITRWAPVNVQFDPEWKINEYRVLKPIDFVLSYFGFYKGKLRFHRLGVNKH